VIHEAGERLGVGHGQKEVDVIGSKHERMRTDLRIQVERSPEDTEQDLIQLSRGPEKKSCLYRPASDFDDRVGRNEAEGTRHSPLSARANVCCGWAAEPGGWHLAAAQDRRCAVRLGQQVVQRGEAVVALDDGGKEGGAAAKCGEQREDLFVDGVVVRGVPEAVA
jgi:hypothetical protein